MLFDNNDNTMDYSIYNLMGLNNNFNNNLVPSNEGFLKGNMFKDEYIPYKNLTYVNINPKSDKESKLLNVMQYSFAINDLNLYLDIHPEDKEMINTLLDCYIYKSVYTLVQLSKEKIFEDAEER